MRLDIVKVLGVDKPVTSVSINGKASTNFLYNIPDQVGRDRHLSDISFVSHLIQILLLYGLDLDMLAQAKQTVAWTTRNH